MDRAGTEAALASPGSSLTLQVEQRQSDWAAGRRRGRDALMSYVDAALAPQRKTGQIKLHGPVAFEGMRRAGRLVAECLDMLADEVRPGVPTEKIDRLVFDFAMSHNATPATLMYRGYRKATCTSVNHVVCHGIPGEKPLKEGDIVNVDVTLILDGWHGDSSRMFGVGVLPRRAERLIEVTYEAMMRGISVIGPGATTGDIGAAIQAYVEGQQMSVVRDFCGHGLGRLFHDEPNIVHVGRPGEGIVLRPGMFFTVEPMINLGRPHVKVLSDGWTAVTRDRSLSAQFEHTVAVTETGVEIFTLSPQGLDRPRLAPGSRNCGVDGPRRHRMCQSEVVEDLKQREPSVTKIIKIGIDTSKSVFQLHGVDAAEKPILRKKLRRQQFLAFVAKLDPSKIGLEACGAAHHWARELSALGHEVVLLPPQYVKPYVKRGKHDAADADAICEAMSRPSMRFVPVKTAEQQAALMLAGTRDQLVRRRTQLTNTIRGYAAEFGLTAAKGVDKMEPLLARVMTDAAMPSLRRSCSPHTAESTPGSSGKFRRSTPS